MSGWRLLPAVSGMRALTRARCSLSPSRHVSSGALVTNGVAFAAVAMPSYTTRLTFAGSLRASHTLTRFGSTRRRIGPASRRGSATNDLLVLRGAGVGEIKPSVAATAPNYP